ncbi:MAG: UDP-3-O-(3-hydroxymyristoyl)glucosamine N-acyltransferase, partial [Candidatus Udaeobacter sp.]
MTFTLEQLAKTSGGELVGDPSLQITGAASLAEATPGEVSFFTNRKYISLLRRTRASAVFVPADFAEPMPAAQIRVSNPTKAFEQVVLKFAPKPITLAPGIHPTAVIDPSAQLGQRVSIQPHAVIEAGARIGDDTIIGAGCYIGHETTIGSSCLIYPRVTIRERSRIGSRVIIHSGAVIGADGFGFEMVDGRQQKIQQLGIVQIDDHVEIGANTTIDRARFGRTWIQEGAKIDNLVQVAHNVIIGKNTVIAAQTGIAGSVQIGQRVLIGGQVGIIGHIEIGDNT